MTPTPATTADGRTPASVAMPLARRSTVPAIPRIAALPALIAASLAVRVFLAAALPLTADEAYAVAVSRSHSLSYYDHPPMMFALARGMADLFGAENAFLMRLPFLAMGTVSIWLLYDITQRIYDRKAALWAAAAFVCSPFFLTFGQSLIVPDGPLDFGLLACLWLIQPILSGADKALWRWPAAGLALGFALLSKYQAVLFGLAAIGSLTLTPLWRVQFRRPGLWTAVAIAALCFSPVLVWNAQHDWASFAFQTGRSYQNTGIVKHLSGLVNVLAGQALSLLPLTWIAAHRRIFATFGTNARAEERLLGLLAVLPILVFDPIALVGRHSLPHWAMSGFLFALPLVGAARVDARGVVMRFRAAAALVLIVAGLIGVQAVSGALSALPIVGKFVPDIGRDNLDWTSLRAAIPDDGSLIVAPDWVSAGRIGMALGSGHTIRVLTDPHQFQFMDSARQATTGFYIDPSCSRAGRQTAIANGLVQSGVAHHILQSHGAGPSFCLTVIPLRVAINTSEGLRQQ